MIRALWAAFLDIWDRAAEMPDIVLAYVENSSRI